MEVSTSRALAAALRMMTRKEPAHNRGSGGRSRALSSARRARITFSTWASNFPLSVSHPVKSAASRRRISARYPLFQLSPKMYPSRFSGISAHTFSPR